MYLVPQMATALVFFIYVSNEGLEQANAQYHGNGRMVLRGGRICGYILTDTLTLVCQGQFNRMDRNAQGVYAYPFHGTEKTPNDGPIRSQDWTNNDRENYAIFPLRSRRNALAYNRAGLFRRRARNVADECCKKGCTFDELRSYCERK